MAGKPRFTAAQMQAAIAQHKGLLYLTARHLHCTYRTVKNYVDRYPSVREALDSARGELIDTAESKLWESIERGEAWGITLCLKTLGRHRGYVERAEVSDVSEYGAGLAGLLAEAQASAREQLASRVNEMAARNGHGVER